MQGDDDLDVDYETGKFDPAYQGCVLTYKTIAGAEEITSEEILKYFFSYGKGLIVSDGEGGGSGRQIGVDLQS